MRPPRRAWAAAGLAAALAACGSSGPGGDGPGAAGSDAGRGDAPGEAAALALTCPSYCDAIMTACTASNQQYSNGDDCLNSCMAFPVGQPDDDFVDSLGCRVRHTALALAAGSADEAHFHCLHAGPGGDSACGDDCSGYCDIAMMYCTAANNAKIYDTRDACMADCMTRQRTVPYTAGDPGRTDMGNEVACVLYHAQMGSSAPVAHCLGDLALTANTCRP
jgi:hypothetical protein